MTDSVRLILRRAAYLLIDGMVPTIRRVEYDVESEAKEVAGIRVLVATPRALYRLKKGTVRPLDHADAAALRRRFGLEDET